MNAATAAPTWRLFLGLWPTQETRAAILRHAELWQWPAAASRTRPERLHVTLHFIGPVDPARIPSLCTALATPWKGCRLQFDRTEVWPGGIAVLEAAVVPEELRALHTALADTLLREGLPVEERRFRPHVTLARKAHGASRPEQFTPVAWEADARFLLLRSLPGGRGYEALQVFG
jgi:RNA 2',3'-cyclic 3'-phosphodiesterase